MESICVSIREKKTVWQMFIFNYNWASIALRLFARYWLVQQQPQRQTTINQKMIWPILVHNFSAYYGLHIAQNHRRFIQHWANSILYWPNTENCFCWLSLVRSLMVACFLRILLYRFSFFTDLLQPVTLSELSGRFQVATFNAWSH